MKYMTFNSSCAYAGVANMLEGYGIDVEDREIALGMKLPYLFSHENGVYLAGSMLQTAEWFNLYLKPKGFVMTETRLPQEEVFSFLQNSCPAMLGISVSTQRKHAVVYTGMEKGCYRFLNNKSRASSKPESLTLTREELSSRLNDFAVVAVLQESSPMAVDFKPYLDNSVSVLLRLKRDIKDFCGREQSSQELKKAQETLFRAILLDGITMLELLGKPDPWAALKSIQREFLEALKENKPLVLADRLSMECFETAIDAYGELIPHL